jgi:GDP-L-fucose synthase
MQSLINIGYGADITIAQAAHAVSQAVGFKGRIDFDPTKPDGTPRKLMDSSRLNALGWRAKVSLAEGLSTTYQDFLQYHGSVMERSECDAATRPFSPRDDEKVLSS